MRFLFSLMLAVASVFMINFNHTAAQTNPPEISYTVSMPRPYTHLLEVEMRVRRPGASPTLELVMPVWTPGSYLVREYARHVQDFNATDRGGRKLPWTKTSKNTWRIDTSSLSNVNEVRVAYQVYANELTVRTNDLNDRHAFWNNAATLLYVNNFLSVPATVRVVPFGDWKIATGLPAVQGAVNTYQAANFDVLYDSPFLVSDFRTLDFEVKGVPHRIVIDGAGNYDANRMRADVQKVVQTTVDIVGGEMPYRNYTFLLMLDPTARGGLEHTNSTALLWTRFGFRPQSSYHNFLSLVAHEFFHVWNVKTIRPDALGPFDYSNENYTRLLWVAEGFTSYYDTLILRRANLISDREFLNRIAGTIRGVQSTPGRNRMSVEEASFDAWIKYYRQDENSINSQISYYDKGSLLAMLLDVEIRRRTNGARSLDDVIRTLYTDFAKRNRNYTPEDLQAVVERVGGGNFAEFFNRYVRGTAELPYDEVLRAVGLRLEAGGGDTQRPFFGAGVAPDGDRLTVRNVPEGTPAYEQGINAGDQIIAVNGVRTTRENFEQRIGDYRPGDQVTVTVFRNDELREIPIKLGARPANDYRIVAINDPNAEQRRQYQNWLDAQLSSLSRPATGDDEE